MELDYPCRVSDWICLRSWIWTETFGVVICDCDRGDCVFTVYALSVDCTESYWIGVIQKNKLKYGTYI